VEGEQGVDRELVRRPMLPAVTGQGGGSGQPSIWRWGKLSSPPPCPCRYLCEIWGSRSTRPLYHQQPNPIKLKLGESIYTLVVDLMAPLLLWCHNGCWRWAEGSGKNRRRKQIKVTLDSPYACYCSTRDTRVERHVPHQTHQYIFTSKYCLRPKKSDVFDFEISCLTVRLIQKFYVKYKIN